MSLYFDAVSILSQDAEAGGSLKSRIYNSKLKSSPANLYALIAEVSKWDIALKEVIDNAGILSREPKLTPLLSLFLTHDLLLSKKGIAAPTSHPLRLAIERHKTRLKAEFTKYRVRRACASVEELQEQLLAAKQTAGANAASSFAPRWVRVNNAVTSLSRELSTTFSTYIAVSSLSELSARGEKSYYVDKHVPDLLALHPSVEVGSFPEYKSGRLILQDKASCFPAYLLVGEQPWQGDIIDACAAPGNKTTHLVSLLSSQAALSNDRYGKILSFDASKARSLTLQKMVDTAGVSKHVTVFAGQDFLAVDPNDRRFSNVTALLLDPSCSGSGIRGRDDVPQLALPSQRYPGQPATAVSKRKRKYNSYKKGNAPTNAVSDSAEEETRDISIDTERLTKLSNLQTQIVEHAFKFPAATRVTYSTCSIHNQENENVVFRALSSSIAKQKGWRVLPRDDQVAGMKEWKHRGLRCPGSDGSNSWRISELESEACIRCWPTDDEGTGGFFVAGFVRDENIPTTNGHVSRGSSVADDDDESWHGFSD